MPPSRVVRGPFARLLAAQAAAETADRAVLVTAALWVSGVGQPLTVAAVTASGYAASIAAAPLGGLLADRRDRRSVLAATSALRAVLAAALAVTAAVPVSPRAVPVVLCAAAAGFSGLGQAFGPARLAAVAALAPGGTGRARACGAAETATSAATVAGPAAAAPLALACGVQAAFAAIAVAYLASALAARLLPALPPGGGDHDAARFRDGLREFRRSPVLPRILAVAAVAQAGTAALTALTLYMVEHGLHGGPAAYGISQIVMGGGLITGSVIAGRVVARTGPRRVTCAGLLVAGILTALFAVQHALTAGLAVYGAYWAVLGLLEAALLPLLLDSAPESALGRCTGLFQACNQSAAVASAVLAGWLAAGPLHGVGVAGYGPVPLILLAGAVFIAASGILAAVLLPAVPRGDSGGHAGRCPSWPPWRRSGRDGRAAAARSGMSDRKEMNHVVT